MVKTETFYKLGPKLCTPPPPHFGKGKPEQPRLQQTARVTTKLPTDPTKVIASNPQVWL